jgi:hypothetical protein
VAAGFTQQLGFGEDQLDASRPACCPRVAQQVAGLVGLALLHHDLRRARAGRNVLVAGRDLAEVFEGEVGVFLLLVELAEEEMDGALVLKSDFSSFSNWLRPVAASPCCRASMATG